MNAGGLERARIRAVLLVSWLAAGSGWTAEGAPVPPEYIRPAPPPSASVMAAPLEALPGVSATVAVAPSGVPVLSGGWLVPPSGGCARLPFTVALTVSNSGGADAAGLTTRLRIEGTAGATVVDWPIMPESIPPGGSTRLAWLLAAPGAGTVQVRARVRAHDATGTVTADSGRLIAPELILIEPGALAVAVSVRPEASVGQTVAIALTISNTGGVRVDHVQAALAPPESGGRFRTLPPPLPNLSIEPLSALRLLWTWSVPGSGVHAFGASVYADSCGGLLPVAAAASATLSSVLPAQLAGIIALSTSRMVSGQKIEVALTISNTGGAAALGLTVPLPTPSTSRAKLVSGPMRGALPLLPGGSATRMTWSWVMEGVGPAWFTGRATAHDANADWSVGTGLMDSPRVRLLAPARVKADQFTLFPEPRVRVGGYVTASLVLTNTGESPAQLTALEIREVTQPGGVLIQRSLVSPSLPTDLPEGDSRSVVWTYRTDAKGTAKLEATAKLKEAATGKSLADVKAVSNQIAATGFLTP